VTGTNATAAHKVTLAEISRCRKTLAQQIEDRFGVLASVGRDDLQGAPRGFVISSPSHWIILIERLDKLLGAPIQLDSL
jgi:hypothetical protein